MGYGKDDVMDSTRFDSQIQVLAKRLADGDSFLAEELRSEMHIAIMSLSETSDNDYMGVARDTAEAYLKGKGIWEKCKKGARLCQDCRTWQKGCHYDTKGNEIGCGHWSGAERSDNG